MAGSNATTNKTTQLGMEVTPGTGVAATKRVDAISFEPSIKLNLKKWMSQGRRYPSAVTPGREWTEWKLTHLPDFNALSYLLMSTLGVVTPTTHSAGTLSKDSIWTGAATGYLTPQTYTVEKGDAKHAGKVSYGLVTGFNIHGNSDASDGAGAMIGQKWQDAISMTSSGSVTAVEKAQITGPMWDWYLDTAIGSIGGTALTNLLDHDLSVAGMFGPKFTSSSANAGTYKDHVDLAPTFDLKLAMETDTAGMSPLAYTRLGSTVFIRGRATGPIIEGAIPYMLTCDLAMKCTAIQPFGDDGGVYKIEWTFSADDSTSATWPYLITLTNKIATL